MLQTPNPLVGKTLTSIQIASDREALLFKTTKGDIKVRVDADCCSHTWVENISLPAMGFPAVVSAVEDLDMPPVQGPSEEYADYNNELKFYGCKITTDRGHIIIDYRNESNGYYGGNLVWPNEDYFYGGVYGQNVSTEEWQDVTE